MQYAIDHWSVIAAIAIVVIIVIRKTLIYAKKVPEMTMATFTGFAYILWDNWPNYWWSLLAFIPIIVLAQMDDETDLAGF